MSTSKEGLEGAPFVVKTFQLVSDGSTNPLVSWSDGKDSFIVWKPVDFASEVLPKYFKHNNFCSFIRQLNTYGFHKVEGKQWEFKHELFRDGQPQLLKDISRRKSKKRANEKEESEQLTPASDANSVVLVKEEPQPKNTKYNNSSSFTEDKDELDKLRDLNQLLMKEVIRLQQQQESAQDAINVILSELLDSRKEQHKLHKKVAHLAKEVSDKYGDNTISLITPPQSPYHPSLEDQKATPANVYVNNAYPVATPNQPVQRPVQPQTPVISAQQQVQQPTHTVQTVPVTNQARKDPTTLESLLLSDENGLLGLDDLAHLELTPHIEQELAKMLSTTLSPPLSPAHQPF